MSMNVPARWRHLLGAAALCTLVSACQAWSPFGHKEQPDLRPFDTPLPVNTQPKRMAIGNRFVVAVKADGTVWSWGSAHEGELGTGDTRHYQPKQLPELSEVIEVSAGFNHVIALKRDGTVWGWGSNQYGQAIGEGPAKVERPTQIKGVSGIKRVAATANGVVMLSQDGDVFILGDTTSGTVDYRDKIVRFPKKVAHIADAASLYASVDCYGVLGLNGEIYDLGISSSLVGYQHEDVPVADVQSKCNYGLLLSRDGTLYAWQGGGPARLFGRKELLQKPELRRLDGLGHFVAIAYQSAAALAMDKQGKVVTWGASVRSQPDPGGWGIDREYKPIRVELENVVEIFAEGLTRAAFTSDGSVYFWGQGSGGLRTREWLDHRPSEEEWMRPEKINWTWK